MNLKQWRESEGLSMRAAAEKCGISPRTWEGWECGPHKPSLEMAVKIMETSGGKVTLSDLAKTGPGGR